MSTLQTDAAARLPMLLLVLAPTAGATYTITIASGSVFVAPNG